MITHFILQFLVPSSRQKIYRHGPADLRATFFMWYQPRLLLHGSPLCLARTRYSSPPFFSPKAHYNSPLALHHSLLQLSLALSSLRFKRMYYFEPRVDRGSGTMVVFQPHGPGSEGGVLAASIFPPYCQVKLVYYWHVNGVGLFIY